MYTRHFHLDDLPFSISPNPRFLYLSRRHQEALAHLLYGVGEGGGFVALTGEVGTGKTTLCNALLEQLPDNVDVALILNPRLDPIELMLTLCDELHIVYPEGTRSMKVLGDALNHYLLEAHGRGRRTVVLIDEAQNLSFDVLEQIRLLTNLETYTEKLLQILLVGQPELIDILNRTELRQLNQRITARYHLNALSETECAAYIEHRLRVCGGHLDLFTSGALRRIWRFSRGIPRLINVVCDRSLLGAFAEGRRNVNRRVVGKAVRELMSPGRTPSRLSPVPVVLTVLLAAITLAAGAHFWPKWENPARSKSVADPVAEVLPLSLRSDPAPSPAMEGGPSREVATEATEGTKETVPARGAAEEGSNGMTGTGAIPEEDTTALDVAELIASQGMDFGTGFAELFLLWDVKVGPEERLTCESAQTHGLACLAHRGNWRQLTRFNHPAVLEFSSKAGGKRYALITAFDGGDPVIVLDGRREEVPLGELLPHWDGYFVLLWRPPAPGVTLLAEWSAPGQIARLRAQLAGDPGNDVPLEATGGFDDEVKAAVISFQRRHGLVTDGIVGPQTLITLAGLEYNSPGAPRLRHRN